jgi:hypothetical protein
MIVPAAASDSEEVIVPAVATEKPLCKEVRKRMAKLAKWASDSKALKAKMAAKAARQAELLVVTVPDLPKAQEEISDAAPPSAGGQSADPPHSAGEISMVFFSCTCPSMLIIILICLLT